LTQFHNGILNKSGLEIFKKFFTQNLIWNTDVVLCITGEWITKEGQIYPQETGKTLALIPYFDKDNTEEQANAKLIAAAPTMLEALKVALEDTEMLLNGDCEPTPDNLIATIEVIKNAINKAT
jgi:hypothetical protein